MKKYFNYILLLGYISFLSGCTKDSEDMPCTSIDVPEDWEKFIGDYQVLDEHGEFSHEMKISHVFSGDNAFGNPADSLLIENFNGLFDIRFEYRTTVDLNNFQIGIIDPLVDKSGNRWYFSLAWDDPETEVIENILVDDTIHFNFTQDNTPYYLEDGQEFSGCGCKETAVLQID